MTRSQVRVLNVTHVHPNQINSPTSPPPHADHTMKLSFLDSFHVATGAIQRLFFYEGRDLPQFPSIVRSLQSSLAATLPVFLPLAGRLTFRPSTRDVVMDCSPSAVSSGVKFVEAEFSGGADGMHRLASDDEHDTEAFMQMVPDLEARELPAPVLAVQVTRPAGYGGAGCVVAVGVSIHHAVGDGQSVWQFMRWWSAASRKALLTAPGLVLPTFDRTAIRHPQADELAGTFLRLLAPALPVLRRSSSATTDKAHQQRRRTFLLSADQIQSLKRLISLQSSRDAATRLSKRASAYVAVSSLAWTCIVRAKFMDRADDAYLMVNADGRRRLRPPLGEGFFGNCVKPCYARANVGDLCGEEGGLACAAASIQDAIREHVEELEDPFSDTEAFLELYGALPPERVSVMGSSHRFMAYETGFGWGAPSRVELVSLFGNREMVLLLGASDGGVQLSVSLDQSHMEAFQNNFRQVTEEAEVTADPIVFT